MQHEEAARRKRVKFVHWNSFVLHPDCIILHFTNFPICPLGQE
jgi:hypothetical protein